MFKKKTVQIAKKANIYRNREIGYPWLMTATDILVSYVLLFLVTAGSAMVYDCVFPIDGSIPALFLCIGIVEAALFPLYLVSALKKYAPFLSFGIFMVIFLFFRDAILTGLTHCTREFLLLFHNYYGGSGSLLGFTEGTAAAGNWAAVCFVMLLVLWSLIEALFYRKNMPLLFLPPLFFICMELLVGMVPTELPIAMAAIGCFGLLPYGNGRFIRHYGSSSCLRGKSALLLVTAIILCFFAADFFGREKAELLASMQEVGLSYQSSLEERLIQYASSGFSGNDPGRVSNNAPQYEEKVVLSITTDTLPSENLYLRGYVGDTYNNGSWTNQSQKIFSSAVSALSAEDQLYSGRYIQNLFFRTQQSNSNRILATYRMHYLDVDDDYAYLPYMANIDTVRNKDNLLFSMPSTADAMLYRAEEERLIFNTVASNHLLYDTKKSLSYSKNEAIETCYEEYLENYLRTPDNLERIKQLGNELSKKLAGIPAAGGYDSLLDTKEINAVFLILKELNERSSYSLSLEPLPFGTDVVEYFLFDSGKGFCEHYASAGVLLLREMGIPARYVTGYVVRPSDFAYSSNKSYTALVKDSATHAWAEIYIQNVGWIPVELTNGSTAETSGLAPFINSSINNNNNTNTANTVNNTAPTESDEQQTEPTADTTDETNTMTASDNKNQTNDQSKNETVEPTDFRLILFWIVCISILAGIFCIIRPVYLERRRTAAFSQKDCRKAVQAIAAYTDRLLWKKNVVRKNDLDDKAYRKTVKEGLPSIADEEWDAYFSVLERAAYSNEIMNQADVKHCYDIYAKVKSFK